MKGEKYRRFCIYFWFVGWDCISLGLHVCVTGPHIEIHLPFGFLKIGWVNQHHDHKAINADEIAWRRTGWE